jgi:hypothetical protein
MEPADERREHLYRVCKKVTQGDAAMEPADERREHLHAEPLLDDREVAAMEPADERREHGSQNSSRLTCRNLGSCERSTKHDPVVCAMDLSSCKKYPLTCVRALLGSRVTTSVLAGQMTTAVDAGSFS